MLIRESEHTLIAAFIYILSFQLIGFPLSRLNIAVVLGWVHSCQYIKM